MAVLVTGIGFVGGYIVRDLVEASEDVVLYGLFGEAPTAPASTPTSTTLATSSVTADGIGSPSSSATSAIASSSAARSRRTGLPASSTWPRWWQQPLS